MRLRGIILIGAVISIIVGFTLGRAVIADSPEPGSEQDPLVTQSYADKKIQERVTDLEKVVAELTVQAAALQDTVNDLQNRIKNTQPTSTTTTKPTNNNNNNNNEQDKEPTKTEEPKQPADNSVVGKSMVINTQNYVNLRSAPTEEANILKRVTKEETMVVQKVENQWYNVKLDDGTIGWVASWVVKPK
ncbi:MAG: SH3 domain-containing protein [Peptococcia bacterium]|jgi:cytoskeletal protein RodZ